MDQSDTKLFGTLQAVLISVAAFLILAGCLISALYGLAVLTGWGLGSA